MSAPAEQLTLPPPRTYTRSDFAALRAWVQRVPVPAIARLYYDADTYDVDTTPYEDDPAALERHLKTMRDDLVHFALLTGSSALAEHLKTSIRQHGSARLTAVSLKMVEAGGQTRRGRADADARGRPVVSAPDRATTGGRGDRHARRADRVLQPPRPSLVASRATHRRRARACWSRGVARTADTLGATIAADVDASEPFDRATPAEAIALAPADGGRTLERLAVPHALSGATGANRAPGLCYLHANHDLDALRAYLACYADQPATLRAYSKRLGPTVSPFARA